MSFKRTSSVAPSSISGREEDARFSDLLRPIKDLTENWQVPLAELLEQYSDELHDLQISVDGQTSSVNFTQAALLLQGTAAIYSKKVEFLYQNVLKMLELLASKKALDEVEGPEGSGSKRGKKSTINDFSGFTLVNIELCNNVDLKSDTAEGTSKRKEFHAKKMTLRFIFVTPRQLIEKESRDQKRTRVNVYVKSGLKYDLLGHKEDFRINSQFCMATAMIGEDLAAETNLGQQSVSLFDDTTLNSEDLNDHDQQPALALGGSDDDCSPIFGNDNLDDPFSCDDHESTNEKENAGAGNSCQPEVMEDEPRCHRELGRKRRDKLEELINEPRAPLGDPWEQVQPHETAPLPVKPKRKGRTCRAPAANIVLTKTSTRTRRGKEPDRKALSPIESFITDEMATSKKNHIRQCDNIPHELEKEAENILKGRKSQKKELKTDDCDEAVEQDADDGDAGADADADDWTDFDGGQEQEAEVDMDMPATAHDVNNDRDGYVDTYQELVTKRVQEFVAQSQEYLESTELAKRVRKWHQTIAPKLEEVEKRGDFDVHDYGTKILDHFSSTQENDKKRRKVTYNFAELVVGKTKEEVARYFLSTLMLANTYNIDIDTDRDNSDSLPMDNVELVLLSTARHHQQIMDYQAPSQEDPTSQSPVQNFPQSSQGTSGKKRKANSGSKSKSRTSGQINGDVQDAKFKVPHPK